MCLCILLQVFINYVTAAASDVCKEKKRSTLTANDVFQGLEELDFQELIPGLQEAYDGKLLHSA
jgi:DNA polymerase epsilon subunit 3